MVTNILAYSASKLELRTTINFLHSKDIVYRLHDELLQVVDTNGSLVEIDLQEQEVLTEVSMDS